MKLLLAGISFLTYVLICGGLVKNHFSGKVNVLIYGISLGSILLIQTALVLSGQDITLVDTLLPVTAYLPFTLGIYVLTGFRLSQTISVGILGSVAVYTLKILNKILVRFYSANLSLRYQTAVLLALAAGVFVFLVFRFLRKPFQRYMESSHTGGWLLLFLPMLMSYLLLSYFSNSASNVKVLTILLLIVLSVFVMVIRIVFFQSIVVDMKETEQKMERQLQMQRQEYEAICRKMEAGRIYRHDMRHHLRILNGLAMQEDVKGILNYIENMGGKLAETEREVYCANAMVNTMLSVCIGQAREAGCAVTSKVHLPEKIIFDEMDVCMVLANALENAINACKEIAEEKKRYIHIMAELFDKRKLLISIKNSCDKVLHFDEDGFPVSDAGKNSEEHGIGLKSIRALVDKYQGFILCRCNQGEFSFQATLFREQRNESPAPLVRGKRGSWKKFSFIFIFSILFLLICLGSQPYPAVFQTMTDEVVIESQVLLQEHSEKIEWGDSGIDVMKPILEDTSLPPQDLPGIETNTEEMNRQIEEYIDEIKGRFMHYYIRKSSGYVGGDISWEVLRDDEVLLSVRMMATINAGGSGDYSRCFTWDKASGKVLALKDLFLEESDYVGIISEEIMRQMTEQVENGQGNYYIPGGIWSDDECFKQINYDQNFYINEENQLVIIFDEYEVAPGSMGMPQFVIDEEVLEEILRGTSMINE